MLVCWLAAAAKAASPRAAPVDVYKRQAQESSEFAPFLNIMNEWYLRDQSTKVAAAYRVKGKAGKPLSLIHI